MTTSVLLQADFLRRCATIDAELNWPRGLAAGRMTAIYAHAQDGDGMHVVRKRTLLEWAGVEPDDADRFIAACCIKKVGDDEFDDHVHFLEPYGEGGDRFLIVGNKQQYDKRQDAIEQRRIAGGNGGRKRAENAAARKAASDRSSGTSSETQAAAKANSKRPLKQPSSDRSSGTSSETQAESKPVSVSVSGLNTELKSECVVTKPRARVDRPAAPPTHEKSQDVEPAMKPEDLIAIWEKHRGTLAAAPSLRGRIGVVRARLAEHDDPRFWAEAVRHLAASDFATGRKPGSRDGTRFRADFNWLLVPGNAEKAAAGELDDHDKPPLEPLRPPTAGCQVCRGGGIVIAVNGNGIVDRFGCPRCDCQCHPPTDAALPGERWSDCTERRGWRLCDRDDNGVWVTPPPPMTAAKIVQLGYEYDDEQTGGSD